ncbi:HlyD family type I secretion periplasmic adaptor subunit [Falsirhodobacter halotolerans]|uniref:HlyD family type I secretion periplasmic adaptor subunit n=1 Tax=Falsirhodobacter halotolerans TaxID=1146892 RepID=UPI001FD41D90|nr:HlyD family type I secretion periplasmic adaptor subunit [Falsirhodobacter halotolerans]MCJ8140665.1 HlyD family type I secretion periplasmic adaptor subunit [Falsirhodobacter halotolerans]
MIAPMRGLILGGVLAIGLLVAGMGGWGAMTRIDGAVVVPAQVQVQMLRQVVQAADDGVVADVLVAEGQAVARGDLLLRLDGGELRSELTIVEGQLYEIIARASRLEAERDGAEAIAFPPDLTQAATTNAQVGRQMRGQVRLFVARRDTFARQLDQLRRRQAQIGSQIDGIDAQSRAVATQLDLIRRELTDQRHLLEQGLTQVSRVLALEREQARLDGEMGSLAAQKAEAQGRVTEVAMEELRLTSERREEAITQMRDFAYQRMELSERQRALLARIDRLDIRAPGAGVVLAMAVTAPQAVVRAGEVVMHLIPQERPRLLEARIPPLHIDEVRAGQPVRVVLSALRDPMSKEAEGVVVSVSADTLREEGGVPYYRAELRLDEAGLPPEGLIPGMPAEAFIRTGSRSPFAYLLQPLTGYFDRAMRES